MSLENHVEALREKHANLDQMIQKEEAQPYTDETRLRALKRMKLRIKDELARLAERS